MTATLDILWTREIKSYPLCDVPWFGRSVVLSNGALQFCCFSDAEVGNVNQQTFEEIWTGPAMQRIRNALSEGHLPRECQTAGCPVYKDQSTGSLVPIIQRLPHDVVKQKSERFAELRQRLEKSELNLTSLAGTQNRQHGPVVVRPGDSIKIQLIVRLDNQQILTDRYLALRYPDGSIHFFPKGDAQPIPFAQACLSDSEDSAEWELPVTDQNQSGTYEVGAALFNPKSSPGFDANCYWSQVKSFVIEKN